MARKLVRRDSALAPIKSSNGAFTQLQVMRRTIVAPIDRLRSRTNALTKDDAGIPTSLGSDDAVTLDERVFHQCPRTSTFV